MIVLGILLLVNPSDRESLLAKYNAAAASFRTNDATTMLQSWNGSIGLVGGIVAQQAVTVIGSTQGVDGAVSVVLSSAVPSDAAGRSSVTFQFSKNVIEQRFVRVVEWNRTVQTQLQCTNVYCTSGANCEAGQSFSCSTAAMRRMCADIAAPSLSYVYAPAPNVGGADCLSSNANCGECSYGVFLTSYCVVMQKTNVTLPPADKVPTQGVGYDVYATESTLMKSCRYPFAAESQLYRPQRSAPLSVPFVVYLDGDPFVVLQELTKGTMDFGATTAQQRGAAIGLILFGVVSCGVLVGGCYCLVGTFCRGRRDENESRQRHNLAVLLQCHESERSLNEHQFEEVKHLERICHEPEATPPTIGASGPRTVLVQEMRLSGSQLVARPPPPVFSKKETSFSL